LIPQSLALHFSKDFEEKKIDWYSRYSNSSNHLGTGLSLFSAIDRHYRLFIYALRNID
jgi:hypothetical protein